MTPRGFQRWSGYGFVLPYLALFAGFLVLPLVFGLVLSFLQWEMLSPLPPRWAGASNYRQALQDGDFWQALGATTRFVLMTVPLTVGLALALSVMLRALPRRQALYRAAFVLPMMVNISVAGILWRWFYDADFGVFNAYLQRLGLPGVMWITSPEWAMRAIVFMTLWWGVGGPAIILLAGLQQIPQHYYEAAAIDGAGRLRQFWHITLPLLRPVLVFVIVLNVIHSFQVFGQAFMITRGGPVNTTRVLVQYIYETAFNHYHMGYAAALSWLLFAIIAAISIVQFRVLREK